MKKLNDFKQHKENLKVKIFSPYIILIRIYTIFLNRFCFYYSIENNSNLFESFQYYQNLFPKYKELNEFLFNELINEFGFFFLSQKYSSYSNFGDGMEYYLNYYFNSSISILCDITLMKYLLSLSEMKDKFNILKIFNFSKIDIMMDFFLNELMNDDSKVKNNELFNKNNKEKKSLKFINSYFEFLLQIIRDNSSMINLCFKFSNIFKMKFKDKIMDKLIERENKFRKSYKK